MAKKFINLSGKRLLSAQLLALKIVGIAEFIEPEEDLKHSMICNEQLSEEDYKTKAEGLIKAFEIAEGDYVHINGIDINLILIMRGLVKAVFVYSKMTKTKTENHKYVTDFISFIELIDK